MKLSVRRLGGAAGRRATMPTISTRMERRSTTRTGLRTEGLSGPASRNVFDAQGPDQRRAPGVHQGLAAVGDGRRHLSRPPIDDSGANTVERFEIRTSKGGAAS